MKIESCPTKQLAKILDGIAKADPSRPIRASLSPVGKVGAFFWNLIFKRFAWTRKLFGINDIRAKERFEKLKNRVRELNDPELSKKLENATLKFNQIFPKPPEQAIPVVPVVPVKPLVPLNNATADRLMALGAEATFSKKAMESWGRLVVSAKDEKTAASLLRNAERLEKFGLFALWMNRLIVEEKIANPEMAIKSMRRILKENQPIVEWIQGIKEKLLSPEEIAQFADPDFAEKNLERLLKLYSIGEPFIKKFDQATPCGKIALLEFFQQAVQSYEEIIQQVVKSEKFPDRRLQAELVHQLIDRHFDLMYDGCFRMMEKQNLLVDPDKKPQGPFGDRPLKAWGKNHKPKDFAKEDLFLILKEGGDHQFVYDRDRSGVYASIKLQTRGIDGMGERIPQMSPEALVHLFDVRPEFFVENTIILKPLRHNDYAIWPETLQETFLTIQGNIRMGLAAMRSDLGIDENVLDETTKEFHEFFRRPFSGVDPDYVTKEKDTVSVYYTPRYARHGGCIKLTYQPLQPEKGLELTLQTTGGNDFDFLHWTALFGSWIEYIPGIDGSTDIDWAFDPQLLSHASFSIRIQPNDPRCKSVLRITGFLIENIRNAHVNEFDAATVEDMMSRVDGFTLKELQPQFFGKCFYGTKDLLNILANDKEWKPLAEGLKHFITGYLQVRPAHWNEEQALEQIAEAVEALKLNALELWNEVREDLAQNEAVKASPAFKAFVM